MKQEDATAITRRDERALATAWLAERNGKKRRRACVTWGRMEDKAAKTIWKLFQEKRELTYNDLLVMTKMERKFLEKVCAKLVKMGLLNKHKLHKATIYEANNEFF